MTESTAGTLHTALADRYRIERELGAGGMATVYLAQDLRHHRQVAVKVLKPELAAVIGAERFLSEIRTTANLQHPHILPLFDSGEAQGQLFYVMPFVEGISLRDRLTREKQLPIPEALRIATEVASALDYAHRHGIIHRDIKPENILLHDGSALVADFGIALAASKAGSARMTETGMSLGTPQYMSPEQAMGERELDARSDVYALGCVTYEMLTGEAPFSGPTAQAIVAKVMTAEPADATSLRKTIPPHVSDAVHTALQKLPADRFESARVFAAALAGEGMVAGRRHASSPRQASPRSVRRTVLLGIGGAAAIAAASFAAGRILDRSPTTELPPSRLAILAPTVGGSGGSALTRQIAITPSGDAIVYEGLSKSLVSLFLRRLDSESSVEIPGTEAASTPAISLDGKTLLATTLTSTVRLPLEGGTPRTVPVPATYLGGAWSPDGSYWYTNFNVSEVARLTPQDSVIAITRKNVQGLRIQQILTDGRTALVVRAPAGTATGPAMLFDLPNESVTPLLDGPVMEVRYAFGELITVMADGSIVAIPFDVRHRRVTGRPTPIASGVMTTGTGIAQFAVADNGTLAYVPETPRSLVLVTRNGSAQTAITERSNVHAPRFSPDGKRLSFDIATAEGRDVWMLSLDQRTLSRATFDRDGHDAVWSPDGRSLTYISLKSGTLTLFRTRPGSTAPAESLFASPNLQFSGTWLPDGSALISDATDLRGASKGDIAKIAGNGRGPIEPLVASPYEENFGAPSPNGRWLAFVSDQSGTQEVYVQPIADGDPVQVSQGGATEPVWSHDGRELFFKSIKGGKAELVAALLRTEPVLSVVSQKTLFGVDEMVGAQPHANYDVSPDGQTFAMVRRSPGSHIVVIQNLPALLRRLRGTGGAMP
jgi:serine/threonine-protein kinase